MFSDKCDTIWRTFVDSWKDKDRSRPGRDSTLSDMKLQKDSFM